jgi:hypothetical protein
VLLSDLRQVERIANALPDLFREFLEILQCAPNPEERFGLGVHTPVMPNQA